MIKLIHLLVFCVVWSGLATAQTDSVVVQAHASYDKVGKFHRKLFGENFRKEWATPVKLPVIKISELGLTPTQLGGGHQTKSMRLEDAHGKEWVIRSIEKNPEVILPEIWRQTFAKDWLLDAMSAQHPYAPLIIPVLADAAGIPHSSPVIGWVAPDTALGRYADIFQNTLCLLEEREPAGNSDNTPKMMKNLDEDNDNTVDTVTFFKARLLDLFVGDWDRHADQWRWVDTKKGKNKKYLPVPRDRDQVLYRNQGFFPKIASRKWLVPRLTGFDGPIKRGNHFWMNGADLNGRLLVQLTHDEWMQYTREFLSQMTDSVLEAALARLPDTIYRLRHDELLQKMKERRGNMEKAMDEYYRFFNRIIDIKMSDKTERIELLDAPDGGLQVNIHKKNGTPIFSKTFDPAITKELRIFMGNGSDSAVIDTENRSIKTRMIGGEGRHVYNVIEAGKRIRVYDQPASAAFMGKTNRLKKHINNDSLTTAYEQVNLYNITMPLVTAGFNIDDGLLLGAGVKFIRRGFHKSPYASTQQITAAYSFSTSAFRIRYKGEWIKALGKADITMQAAVFAPNNTMNFFGRGNETQYIKEGEHRKFHRIRYNTYLANPSIRWSTGTGSSLSVGPSIWYYTFDSSDNAGRFINNTKLIGSYDSSSISQNRAHAGLVVHFVSDKRNSTILPTGGYFASIKAQGYTGLNDHSKSFVQFIPEFAVYKNISRRPAVIIADRIGGAVTMGKTAFYQSAFLGGHENLLGYRQYRYAGQHMAYNNFEIRYAIANLANYILPGTIGLTGFYDIGRVWEDNESSNTWHHGVGGGLFFSPAQMAMFQFVMGYSKEGWYPYFTMGFRF